MLPVTNTQPYNKTRVINQTHKLLLFKCSTSGLKIQQGATPSFWTKSESPKNFYFCILCLQFLSTAADVTARAEQAAKQKNLPWKKSRQILFTEIDKIWPVKMAVRCSPFSTSPTATCIGRQVHLSQLWHCQPLGHNLRSTTPIPQEEVSTSIPFRKTFALGFEWEGTSTPPTTEQLYQWPYCQKKARPTSANSRPSK